MSDSVGPIAKNAEISDESGPTIAHQMSDGDGPIIKKTEIVDANGPTIAHQMSEGVGPIIKKTEITDADGPTINHQMSDANGPVIKRVLENSIVKLPTITNPIASISKTDLQSSGHQAENSSISEPTQRVDTFSVHMAERIAKMKSEQKETKTKMDDLEADTQKMQVKLTKK
jgi:predicted transcriptional regulator